VDNEEYLELAIRLANATLTDLPALRATLHEEPWWADRAGPDDLEALRVTAAGLRAALAAVVAADPAAVLSSVNALLDAHPPRPRLSGHAQHGEDPNWHVHVAQPDAPPAKEVAAAASWGLAQGLVRYGPGRWGRCAALGCTAFYLDTSTNLAKRFCSVRCANRAHVAAFRARRRPGAER
jgi:predicted RNA-binding Zn ribbon-like protein